MISIKNGKYVLSLYAVVTHADELPLLAHEVTVNHTSGILSFWRRSDTTDKYERVQAFSRDSWIRYYKVKDYPDGYPPKA